MTFIARALPSSAFGTFSPAVRLRGEKATYWWFSRSA
jgi:hypothetical protein